MKQNAKIHQSADYSLFKNHKFQRNIVQKQIKNLTKSMDEYGFLPYRSILAVKDDKGMTIVDGHHRFETAKKIGIPFYYMVIDGDSSEDIDKLMIKINMLSVNWGCKDFVEYYAKKGHLAYLELLELHNQGVTIGGSIDLLGKQKHSTKIIKDGKFEIGNRDDAKFYLSLECAEKSKICKKRNFIRSLKSVLNADEIDKSRLKDSLDKYYHLIQDVSTVEDMLKEIEEVYNYRRNKKSKAPLAFLASNNQLPE